MRFPVFNPDYDIEDAYDEAMYEEFDKEFEGCLWTDILKYFPDDDDFDDTYW